MKKSDLMDLGSEWNVGQPIYRQLRDFVVEMILDGKLAEGDVLPSVRHVAGEFRLNPLTVLKSYQLLVGEGLVESRRGRGGLETPIPLPHEESFTELEAGAIGRKTQRRVTSRTWGIPTIANRRQLWATLVLS